MRFFFSVKPTVNELFVFELIDLGMTINLMMVIIKTTISFIQ
jgi:hypothetical protein